MTWQGTGTFCVAFTTLASNSGMCGTILYATSTPSGLPECRTVPASTCIFLMWNIYCDIAFRYFKTIFFVSFGCACVCTTLGVVHKKPGADPGFWFGRGIGKKSPIGFQGHGKALVKVWGLHLQAWRMLRLEAEKNHSLREKASPYRLLTLYDNIIIIIISSTHRFMFPAIFVLKYKMQSAGSRASKIVHNGSRA